MRHRGVLLSLATLAGLIGAWTYNPFERYDPEPWLADYRKLRDETSAAYANLEYALAKKAVDAALG